MLILSKMIRYSCLSTRLINQKGWSYKLLCTNKMLLSTNLEQETNRKYSIPWPHYSRPIARRAPLLHRLAGHFLLSRGSRLLGSVFSTTEFLLGVSDAVKAYTDVLCEHCNGYHDLKAMLSPSLYKSVENSLSNLPGGAKLDMDVDAIKGQTLCSVNTIFGNANPDDEHSIEWLGQKVLTNKSRMMEIFEGDSSFTLQNARALGAEATLNRLEFVLGVSFFTRTCFKVVDDTGQVLLGGKNQYVEEFHYWKFSSLIHYDKDYPFEWIITDINNFIYNST